VISELAGDGWRFELGSCRRLLSGQEEAAVRSAMRTNAEHEMPR
jgi:hypothetical protein